MVKRLNEYNGSFQLEQLGRLMNMLRDTNGLHMDEYLDDLLSLYLNMYKNGKASQGECVDFYDRVKPILESLEYALEEFISESNIVLTDRKYRNFN